MPAEPLSVEEQAVLRRCELTVINGRTVVLRVGNALREIRDGRLYRERAQTFEEYCRERFKLSRPHAYRLIGAADVVDNLSPRGDTPAPISEKQVRPLVGLEPEQQRKVWEKATAGGKTPTAREVIDIKAEVVGAQRTNPYFDLRYEIVDL